MRHILFICLLFFCVACEENKSVDPTLMPETTTTGENTLGCLIDGWVYVSGRWRVKHSRIQMCLLIIKI